MHSVIDLTGRRPRRIPATVPGPGVIDLTSGAVPAPRVMRASDILPAGPTARLGGHRFTGSLAADILARRPLSRPAHTPHLLRNPPKPLPAARPPKAPKLGGMFGPRGKPRKVTKNQLHGRGSGYTYKRRQSRRRFFDSAGSYSAGGPSKKRAVAPKKAPGEAKKRGAKRRAARAGKGRRKRAVPKTDRARTTADLVKIAAALRRSSEARLRRMSAVH